MRKYRNGTNLRIWGKYQFLPNSQPLIHWLGLIIPTKYQKLWDWNTKYQFGIGLVSVYQKVGIRLTSLVSTTQLWRQSPNTATDNCWWGTPLRRGDVIKDTCDVIRVRELGAKWGDGKRRGFVTVTASLSYTLSRGRIIKGFDWGCLSTPEHPFKFHCPKLHLK